MIDNTVIEKCAKDAARIADAILELGWDYTIILINDPHNPSVGTLDLVTDEIAINLAVLKPYPVETLSHLCDVPEDAEDFALLLKVYFVVYHEMRHLYQKLALELYAYYKTDTSVELLESPETCERWLAAINHQNVKSEAEVDADCFAAYLIARFPIQKQIKGSDERTAEFKRRYDKIEIPVQRPDLPPISFLR